MARRKLTNEERRKPREAFPGMRADLGELRSVLEVAAERCDRRRRTSSAAARGCVG
jgi:hypothetical protein